MTEAAAAAAVSADGGAAPPSPDLPALSSPTAAAADEDEDEWTKDETDGMAPPLAEALDAQLAAGKAELMRHLAVEAAKWSIGTKLLPADSEEKKRALNKCLGAALTMKQQEFSAGRPKPPSFGDGLSGREAEQVEALWKLRYGELLKRLRDECLSTTFTHATRAEASKTSEPWVAAVMKAKEGVMDPNEPALLDHMEGTWRDEVAKAKKQLGSHAAPSRGDVKDASAATGICAR